MAALDAKLKALTQSVGFICTLHFDGNLDRWVCWYLREMPNTDGRKPATQIRETLGCGRTAEDAIDASYRKLHVQPPGCSGVVFDDSPFGQNADLRL